VGRGAVAGDRHEVDLAGNRQVTHEVGHEEDRPLENADEQRVLGDVAGGDLRAELGDPAAQRFLLDEDLRDAARELGHGHSRVASTPGASTMPGTATTSSPRTTSGQLSRSVRGILASTNT